MHAQPGHATAQALTRQSPVGPIVAAWLFSIAIDFFLHGGLLARLYLQETPFLLTARDAFARIPLGYAAFLLLAIALWWLLARLGIRTGREGLAIGTIVGAVVWGALLLGLYSISTAPADLLAGWWVGQSVELGGAGLVLGSALGEGSRKRIYQRVAGAAILLLVGTIVLQMTGWAPPMELAVTIAGAGPGGVG